MCEYCEKEKTMMEETVVSPGMISWCCPIKQEDVWRFEYKSGVFIDTRGYLRLVDLDDCQCLDAGQKIKINFCPMCGAKMETPE